MMILFRGQAVWGAGLLALFLVPAAFLIHNFWTETEPMAKATQMAHHGKDLALAGAAMLYAVCVRGA